MDLLPYESVKIATLFKKKMSKPWLLKKIKGDDEVIALHLYDVIRGDELADKLCKYYKAAEQGQSICIRKPIASLVRKLLLKDIRSKAVECFPPDAVGIVAKILKIKYKIPATHYKSYSNIIRELLKKKYNVEVCSAYNMKFRNKKVYVVIAYITHKKKNLGRVTTLELNKILKGKYNIHKVIDYSKQMYIPNHFLIRFVNT